MTAAPAPSPAEQPVIHATPVAGPHDGPAPCCGLYGFEIALVDDYADDPEKVTCRPAPLSSLADHADERFTEAQLAQVAEFESAVEPEEVTVIRAMLELADNLDYYASKTTGGTHASGLEDAAAQLRAAQDPS